MVYTAFMFIIIIIIQPGAAYSFIKQPIILLDRYERMPG